ncbi:MAG: tyrosine-type recombinase/integrase [Prevotella sp.]
MRYPFVTAAKIFLDAYSGVYSEGMWAELHRRYPKIARQLEHLETKGKISTTNPSKLTPVDIKEYVVYQRSRGLKPTSISHDICAISTLCIFTSNNNCVDVARVRYPILFPHRPNKRLPVTERPEFDRILKFASVLTTVSDPLRIRCYAETLFAYGTGPRTQELQHAKYKFLDNDCVSVFFDHVKGGDSYGQCRTVPVRPEVRPTLQLWMSIRNSDSVYLFPNKDGGFLSTNSLTKDRNVVCNDTGISFDYRKCRRTYAQYLIDEGLSVEKLAVILGHSNSKTTEKSYARPRDDRVVAEVINSWSEKK